MSGDCPSGQSIRVIKADGSVSCEVDADTNTTYSAGSGLQLSGTTFSANTAVVHARVSGDCSVGQYNRAIAANGTVTCDSEFPAVLVASRRNTSGGATIFEEDNHSLVVTFAAGGGANDFTIESNNRGGGTFVAINDGTGTTESDLLSFGEALTKTVSTTRITTIDLSEFFSSTDHLYRYICVSINLSNLVKCRQEIY